MLTAGSRFHRASTSKRAGMFAVTSQAVGKEMAAMSMGCPSPIGKLLVIRESVGPQSDLFPKFNFLLLEQYKQQSDLILSLFMVVD